VFVCVCLLCVSLLFVGSVRTFCVGCVYLCVSVNFVCVCVCCVLFVKLCLLNVCDFFTIVYGVRV